MAKVSFEIWKELSDGKIVLDPDVPTKDLSILVITTDPSVGNKVIRGTSIRNNGDGTYIFDAQGTGRYSVIYKNEIQQEFYYSNIADGDLLTKTTINDDDFTFNGTDFLSISGSALSQSMIINNVTTSGSLFPLSAYQGNVLNGLIANLEDADSTILKTSDIVQTFTGSAIGTNTDRLVQSAESLKVDLDKPRARYVFGQRTYNGALRVLDAVLYYLDTAISQSTISYHYMWYGTGSILQVENSDENTHFLKTEAGANGYSGSYGYMMLRSGSLSGLTWGLNYTTASEEGWDLNLAVLRRPASGSLVRTVLVPNYDLGYESNYKSGSIFDKTIRFGQGDHLSIEASMSVGAVGDKTERIEDLSVLLQLVYDDGRSVKEPKQQTYYAQTTD